MKKQIFDISKFHEQSDLLEEIDLLVAVKSFDLEAIRKRYLKSRNRSKTGSVERRKPSTGGLVHLTIKNGKIEEYKIIAKLIEPRGIDAKANIFALSSENIVYIFNSAFPEPKVIKNEWLSYIHTVRLNSDESRILVSSSGLDSIFEFDTTHGKKLWEWFAWENGFNSGENPETGERHILTRSVPTEDNKNIKTIVINDPKNQTLPTALRAAFINSAEYDESGNIFATLFHHGIVIKISKSTSDWEKVFENLSKPHGGMLVNNFNVVTDTAGGRVIVKDFENWKEYHFHNLPGKTETLKNLEWLQFSRLYKNILITIDSNRNNLMFIDIEQNKKMSVSYNPNWALQEFQIIESHSLSNLKCIQNWFSKQQ